MKLLCTGFEPFDNDTINPSWEAVRRLKAPEGAELIRACLPVSFEEAPRALEALILSHRPDAVLCVGQAGGRRGVSLERVAVNLMDARIPDNQGAQPREEPVCPGGPAAFFSTLPLRRLETALRQAGIPAEISNTAGLFVCNCVFYTAMRLTQRFPGLRAGFLHMPVLPEQGEEKGLPCLSLEEDIRALSIVCREIAAVC